MSITLYTSGTTKEPKVIEHSWEYLKQCAEYTIAEMKLTKDSRVLDVYPSNTIAHWTISAYPAVLSGCDYSCMKFDAKTYVRNFIRIQPTHIYLVPAHLPLLEAEPTFTDLDMTCVEYCVLGADIVTQDMCDLLRRKGATVRVWYGMTENPPPVLIGYGSPIFTRFNPAFDLTWTEENELIINGEPTKDIFDHEQWIDGLEKGGLSPQYIAGLVYNRRIQGVPGKATWKNTF
jgi:long-subunit acyl-CoA synthetase (AMP-forming)